MNRNPIDPSTLEGSLRVLDIVDGTCVDGPHFRSSVYLAGCSHHCPGCHNPSSWDPDGGKPTTLAALAAYLLKGGLPVTLSGGDPMMHPREIGALAHCLRSNGVNLWCYSGYTFEAILADKDMAGALRWFDVLVDGPFVEALRDTSLLFRGSSNQRLIDVGRSLDAGVPVLWEQDF
ncbi:MAG: anaerobic ribonucleoside-triphosphate reductase activating protein [Clostridium sp.]|nr:anaerobic ribonucleoside-triphosphate reductase activating protein [Clostridium sp.]